jgi:RNA polymerase sigma-70 factor (ECF subfamily)
MRSPSPVDHHDLRGDAVPHLADDAALVARARAELPYCTGAFEALMRRHGGRIRALTRRFTACAADAEDLAQEVMLKVFFELPRFRSESAFSTWLWRVTANVCIDHRRKAQAWPLTVSLHDSETREDAHAVADSKDAIAATEARLDAEALLARLAPDDRMLVLLRLLVGLEFAEIAEAMGLGLSATKMRYARALQRLKEGAECAGSVPSIESRWTTDGSDARASR